MENKFKKNQQLMLELIKGLDNLNGKLGKMLKIVKQAPELTKTAEYNRKNKPE